METQKARAETAEVKAELDESSALAAMVEKLSEKNLELTEAVRTRDATIRDLEELRDLGEEMELIAQESLEQMKAELRDEASRCARAEAELSRAKLAVAEHEATSAKFREAVRLLTAQLAEARSQAGAEAEKGAGARGKAHEVLSENMALQARAAQVDSFRVEAAAARAASEAAAHHLTLLKSLLPGSLFETELNAAEAASIVRRALAKAAVVEDAAARAVREEAGLDTSQQLQQQLLQPASVEEALAKLLAAVADKAPAALSDDAMLNLDLLLAMPILSHYLRCAEAALDSVEEDAYRRAVGMKRHFATTETVLDGVIASLRSRSLARHAVESLSAEASRLQVLLDPLGASLPPWRALTHGITGLGRSAVSASVKVRRVGAIVAALAGSGSGGGAEESKGGGSGAASMAAVTAILTSAMELRASAVALCRSLEGRALRVSPIVRKKLAAATEALATAEQVIADTAEKLSGVSPSSSVRDASLAAAAAALVGAPGSVPDPAGSSVASLLAKAIETVSEIQGLAGNGGLDDVSASAIVRTSQWLLAAAGKASAIVEAAGMKEKIEDTFEKLKAKTAQVQALTLQVQDNAVKCDTLERKLAEARLVADATDAAQRQVDTLLASKKTLEIENDELQAANLTLEKDNRDLKERLRAAERRRGTESGSGSGGAGALPPATPARDGSGASGGAGGAAAGGSAAAAAAGAGTAAAGATLHLLQTPKAGGGGAGAAGGAGMAPGTVGRAGQAVVAAADAGEVAELLGTVAALRNALAHVQEEKQALLLEKARDALEDIPALREVTTTSYPAPGSHAERLSIAAAKVSTMLATVTDAAARVTVPLLGSKEALESRNRLRAMELTARSVEAEARREAFTPVPGSAVPGRFASIGRFTPAAISGITAGTLRAKVRLPGASGDKAVETPVLKVNAGLHELRSLHSIFSC